MAAPAPANPAIPTFTGKFPLDRDKGGDGLGASLGNYLNKDFSLASFRKAVIDGVPFILCELLLLVLLVALRL